jgi:hypothetical protein
MLTKGEAFVQFIKQKSGKELTSNIEAACVDLVGQDKISQLLADMNEKRAATNRISLRKT